MRKLFILLAVIAVLVVAFAATAIAQPTGGQFCSPWTWAWFGGPGHWYWQWYEWCWSPWQGWFRIWGGWGW
jgi:hypothetical protein